MSLFYEDLDLKQNRKQLSMVWHKGVQQLTVVGITAPHDNSGKDIIDLFLENAHLGYRSKHIVANIKITVKGLTR